MWFKKNHKKSTLSKKQKTITNKQQNSVCLCGSKKIIKINPFKKTKNHNPQATNSKTLCAYVVEKKS